MSNLECLVCDRTDCTHLATGRMARTRRERWTAPHTLVTLTATAGLGATLIYNLAHGFASLAAQPPL